MFTKSKIAAFALATLVSTTAIAATSSQALAGGGGGHGHHGFGWGGVGLGFAAGALIGSAAYGSPGYVLAPTYRCRLVRVFDTNGFYIGKQRVCDGGQVVVY